MFIVVIYYIQKRFINFYLYVNCRKKYMFSNNLQQLTPLPFQSNSAQQGEKSSRTVEFYDKIDNLLKQNNSSTIGVESQTKLKILQELEMFHEFYKKRYEQLKQNYQKLSKINWEQANQILQYEKQFQNHQRTLNESVEKNFILEQHLAKALEEKSKIGADYEEKLRKKDRQILELNRKLKNDLSLNEIKKKKILKIRDKENVQNQQDGNSHVLKQILIEKQKNQSLTVENEELMKCNESMQKKIKHFEADKKYENQRIKNATLALELDGKLKTKQIQRLNNQVSIYQTKFQELLSLQQNKQKNLFDSENNSGLSSCNLTSDDSHHENLGKKSIQKLIQNAKVPEKTQKKFDLPKSARMHKRHGSANLDENNHRDDLDMKIKIIRYDKSKKKF